MKKDTILFILQIIERELEFADLPRQLYLIERRNINLKKLENYGRCKNINSNGINLDSVIADSFNGEIIA